MKRPSLKKVKGSSEAAIPARYDRFYQQDPSAPFREASERDRDRILYTNALRRLAGITQVVASDSIHSLHNRLTHVLEVAQIGRRLAQRLLRQPEGREIAEAVGGVDPEVVEAACLAHDLGHPPFGHTAEEELDELAIHHKQPDGFEGNAQSFRVLTKLAFRRRDIPGLNLTRATLNATLKYPWHRGTAGKQSHKWGAYHSEEKEFEWARALQPHDSRKSAEAELMDFADDIAYSVHDVEDFYIAKRIPLDRLIIDPAEVERFLLGAFTRWATTDEAEKEQARQAFSRLIEVFRLSIFEPYVGTRDQRSLLCQMSSVLVGRFIEGIKLRPSENDALVEIQPNISQEIKVLKELTWYYVINNPALATQQHGQRKMIRELFEIFHKAVTSEHRSHILPQQSWEQLEQLKQTKGVDPAAGRTRIVLDLIAGMSESQIVETHHRLTGVALGSGLAAVY